MMQSNSRAYIESVIRSTIPALRYDGKEDYLQWKERAGEKLYELLGLPFDRCDDEMQILSEEDCGAYRKIEFAFQSEKGYFVPAGIMIPKDRKAPMPTAICLQGHSSGMHISMGYAKFPQDEAVLPSRDIAVQAVKEGYCAVVMEQRYMGACGQDELGAPLCARKGASLPTLLMGRTAVGERVWDVQRLLDVLEKYFNRYIDMERLVCMGNSGGGVTTFYAACVDERIRLAVPSCSVCEFEDSFVPIHHCACSYIPGIRKYFEMGDLAGLMAGRKLVIVCGVKDTDFPIWGVEKSYERAKSVFAKIGRAEYCRLLRGSEGHQFYPELAWPVISELI